MAVSRICNGVFFYCLNHLTLKKVAYASVVISVSLAALACLSLKSKSYFRWPVAIVAGTSSAFFFFLWLVLSRPAMKGKNPEIQNTPPQINSSSASPPIRENNPLVQSAKNAATILMTHGKISASPQEIFSCVKASPKDLQDRLFNNGGDPMELCREIEEELYKQAKKSLTDWGQYEVDKAMQWIEILVNLQKKPNPSQDGKKALKLADKARLYLSFYCPSIISNPTELFLIVNFFAEQSEDKPPPDLDHWSSECRKQFFVTLGKMIQNQEHTILTLNILKVLTANGYTFEKIKAASVRMKPSTKAHRTSDQQELLEQALDVLKTANLG